MNTRKGFCHTGLLECHWIPPLRRGKEHKKGSHVTQFSVLNCLKTWKALKKQGMTNIVGSEGLTITQFKNQGSSRQLCIGSALLTSLNLTSSSSSDAQTVIFTTDTDGIQSFSHSFNRVLKAKSNTPYKRRPSHYEQCKLPSFKPSLFPVPRPANSSQPRTATAAPPTAGSPLLAHYSTREGVGLSRYRLGTVPVQKSPRTHVKKAKAR